MVEVVNVQTCVPAWEQPGDVRIDRQTKWGNPFKMQGNSDLERDRVCRLYEVYFKQSNLDISELLHAKRLGCWCKPKRCHGDTLARKITEYENKLQILVVDYDP